MYMYNLSEFFHNNSDFRMNSFSNMTEQRLYSSDRIQKDSEYEIQLNNSDKIKKDSEYEIWLNNYELFRNAATQKSL